MRKNSFVKILNHRGHSTSADFTPREKKKLFAFFGMYGMTKGTLHNRFFRDGFKEWEIKGVELCIKEYCSKAGVEPPDRMEDFFKTCDRKTFVSYMSLQGMSRPTVYKRFDAWLFKVWEVKGIENLIDCLLVGEVNDA